MFVLAEARKVTRPGDVVGSASVDSLLTKPQSLTRRVYADHLKRVLDLVLCALMLPVLLPVMAVIWVLVRRDGGPGLFTQTRIGRDGRVFRCFKFRSMVVNAEQVLQDMCARNPDVAAEWLKYQKLKNDPRISRVGRLLRATSLDELPQIFNVLLGDMSLVGPRPFLPSQKALYDEAGGSAYYRVRPGVTGPWQVFGRSATTFKDRVRFDNAYYQNLSLGADLGLILRTAMVVVRRTGK